jgi:hypothetical protein
MWKIVRSSAFGWCACALGLLGLFVRGCQFSNWLEGRDVNESASNSGLVAFILGGAGVIAQSVVRLVDYIRRRHQ